MAQGAIQPTLFDETDMAQISHPDYSGERLIACYNPFLAAEQARKRGELLEATKAELKKNRRRHPAGPSAGAQGQDRSGRGQGDQQEEGGQAFHHGHHRRRAYLAAG